MGWGTYVQITSQWNLWKKMWKTEMFKEIKNIKTVLQDFRKLFLGVWASVSIPVYQYQSATGYVTDGKRLHSSTTVLITNLVGSIALVNNLFFFYTSNLKGLTIQQYKNKKF